MLSSFASKSQFCAASTLPVLCEFSGHLYSSSQAVAPECLTAVYGNCRTLVYYKELDYPTRYRSQTWQDCQARPPSCKHKSEHFERAGTVHMGKRCCSSWGIRQRWALKGLMESLGNVAFLCLCLLGFGFWTLSGTWLEEGGAADRRDWGSQRQNFSSSISGLGSTCWLSLLLVVCLLAGWRQCPTACDAALVLFALPLGFSFCSLLLFMPLVWLAAVLVAVIRFCSNQVVKPALGDTFCTPKVRPSKEEKRLHRRTQKHLRKLIRRAKQHESEKRAAIGSAACWIAVSLSVCAAIVRVMTTLLAAIVALGLVDIRLHIIATTENLGSSKQDDLFQIYCCTGL